MVLIFDKNNLTNELVNKIKNVFDKCDDFNVREILLGNSQKAYVLNIGNFSDRNFISETVIKPLTSHNTELSDEQELLGIISASELKKISSDINTIREKILIGNAVIICQINNEVISFGATAKRGNSRSISEPDGEVVVRGPREGFIENSEDNVALLRKRIRSDKLKCETVKVGLYTQTTVNIMYIDGIADKNVVAEIIEKLKEIKLPGVIDSGYIEHFFQQNQFSLLPSTGNSEKPDKVAAKMLEGRVAVICDGSPIILTIPYLFIESIQSSEDYLKTPIYASFVRVIRLISTILALFLPSFYLVSLEYHTTNLPYKLYKTIITSRLEIPFSVFGELLVILIIFEIIREVSLRMPRAIGDAVGIVAGLILGDAAISAGISSPPVIMVVALTAVCSFIIPPFMNSIVIIRIVTLLLAKLLGYTGIVLSFIFLIVVLCSKESFGVPYLLPISPLKKNSLIDTLILLPKKSIKKTLKELRK